MRLFATALTAALCAFVSTAAPAAVVYDTLGPSDAYSSVEAWAVGGVLAGYNFVQAELFTPTQAGNLSSVTAALAYQAGDLSPVQFEIRSDDNGQPGQIIASAIVPVTAQAGLYTASFSGSLELLSTTQYWFGLAETNAGTQVGWDMNTSGFQGTHASTGAPWQQPGEWFLQEWTLGGYRVEAASATPVPEPPMALMLLLGMPLLAVAARRRSSEG